MNEFNVLRKPKERLFKNTQNMTIEESLQYEKEFSTNEIVIPMIKRIGAGNIGSRTILRNGQEFICYIERYNKDRKFYPVGIEGRDMGYEKNVVPIAIYNKDYDDLVPLTSDMIKNAELVCEHTSDLWAITGERKGNKWYWSKNWINEKFVGFKQIVKGSDNGYRCRMDIHVAGDAWISEEEITGSIRMIDNEDDRAIMYFVTFTDDIYSPKPKDGIYPIFNKSDLAS